MKITTREVGVQNVFQDEDGNEQYGHIMPMDCVRFLADERYIKDYIGWTFLRLEKVTTVTTIEPYLEQA